MSLRPITATFAFVVIASATAQAATAEESSYGPLLGHAPSTAELVSGFGDAGILGSTSDLRLNLPVVGMASTPIGNGYWLVASDGGIFAYGDAQFYGSTGSITLNKPIVGMASTPTGNGYWLVASDGGIFAYGDAQFYGSIASSEQQNPIVAMAASPAGGGYWLVSGSGQVFGFGPGATQRGDLSDQSSSEGQVVAIVPTETSNGYWLTTNRTGSIASIWRSGGLDSATLDAALGLASELGIPATVRQWATVSLMAHHRGSTRLDDLDPGWRYGLSTLIAETGSASVIIGGEAASALDSGQVVIGFTAAKLRDVKPGDSYTVLGWDGRLHSLVIGAIVADELVGSAELVLGRSQARALGIYRPTSVRFWYAGESEALVRGLEAIEATGAYVRSWHSWSDEPGSLDSVLSTAKLKLEYGNPAFLPAGSSAVILDSDWIAENIQRVSLPIVGAASCHKVIIEDLVAALQEVEDSGLAPYLDPADFRRAGGCFVPRLIRGPSGGAISRHSWGIAIDFNPSSNSFGTTPTMELGIVEIFRRHGFAWGGTWTRPDGMHFEHRDP